jgi:hypothetical protein
MPPVCVQLSVLVEDHEIVKLCPARTLPGLNEIAAVGVEAGLTVSVIGAEVTLLSYNASVPQVTVRIHVPDAAGAVVADPCGQGVVPNGELLSNGGSGIASKGRPGWSVEISQSDRFEFHVSVE